MNSLAETSLDTQLLVLQSHLDGLLDRIRHNSLLWRRFQQFERHLLSLNSLSELILYVLKEGRNFFDLDFISIYLVDADGMLKSYLDEDQIDAQSHPELLLASSPDLLKQAFGVSVKPFIGPYKSTKCADFFAFGSRKPVSVAIIPLYRRGRYLGSLNFGSLKADRFADHMATDFIEQLVSVVSTCLENHLNFEVLRRTSLIDELTGVNNRRFLKQRLLEEIDRSRRTHESLACLFLDIDHFKNVNDTHGHQAGDFVLAEVAALIKRLLRNNDVLARYGGEEFVAILSGVDSSLLLVICERIRQKVADHVFDYGQKTLRLTLSIGAALYEPSRARDVGSPDIAQHLLGKADNALYQAKSQGRDQVCHHGVIFVSGKSSRLLKKA